jgi:hypothetical protein
MWRVTIDVEIEPFRVPNFLVPKQKYTEDKDPSNSVPAIPLREADPKLLDQLCKRFREDVFAKAGKPDPEVYK